MRESADAPIPLATLSEIEVHRASLQDVLDTFGAPLTVWEYGRTSAAVAYGWYASSRYNVKVFYRLAGGNSSDVSYDDSEAQMNGVVFFFDEDWVLTSWRAGRLKDLLEERSRLRPTLPPPR